MHNKTNQIIKYLLPMVLSAVLFCIIFAIKKLFPFGSETIDYYDLAQKTVAFYHQVYDELHGNKSIFFDWYTSLGRGIPGGTFISPFNILFYSTPRSAILEYIFTIMLVKVMLM